MYQPGLTVLKVKSVVAWTVSFEHMIFKRWLLSNDEISTPKISKRVLTRRSYSQPLRLSEPRVRQIKED